MSTFKVTESDTALLSTRRLKTGFQFTYRLLPFCESVTIRKLSLSHTHTNTSFKVKMRFSLAENGEDA